jgi:hypothetical protein
MKLLEMLYNHFEGKWPRRAHNIGQDRDGVTWLNEDDTDLFISTSGIWSSTCFDSIQLDVAEDYATSVITKKMFKEYCKKQKEKQMNKVFTEAQKIDIVGDFLNNNYDGASKTEFARLHSTSSRSLGRWIDKYADLVIRKVPIDPARGTKENPFQIGDIVEVSESINIDYGYTKATEYYDKDIEGRGVIVGTDYYNYNEYYFPNIDVEIDGESYRVEICHVRYIKDDTQDSPTEIVTNYSITNDTVLGIKQD